MKLAPSLIACSSICAYQHMISNDHPKTKPGPCEDVVILQLSKSNIGKIARIRSCKSSNPTKAEIQKGATQTFSALSWQLNHDLKFLVWQMKHKHEGSGE